MEAASRIYWLQRTEADVPEDGDWLTWSEKQRLQTLLMPKRRRDWRLGRWTLKCAVSAFGRLVGCECPVQSVEVTVADSGAPCVFALGATLVVSLSHRAGTAIAAVAFSSTAIGCDTELIERRSEAFLTDYFTADEQALISRSLNQAEIAFTTTLLWSAKESVLKACQVGLRADLRDIHILLSQDADRAARFSSYVNPQEWRPYSVSTPEHRTLQGWWSHDGSFIRTIAGRSSTPPVHLDSDSFADTFRPRAVAISGTEP